MLLLDPIVSTAWAVRVIDLGKRNGVTAGYAPQVQQRAIQGEKIMDSTEEEVQVVSSTIRAELYVVETPQCMFR